VGTVALRLGGYVRPGARVSVAVPIGWAPPQGTGQGHRDVADRRLALRMTDAGRVIAGTARSIRLDAPGPGTRPLADRVKQTLFAVLEPDLFGSRFLDLFAGSGAAGIEALSRGAATATFVERDAGAARVIAGNLARTHLGDPERVTVVRQDVLAWLRDPARADEAPYDLVVVDPPYAETATLQDALGAVGPCLAPGARVVAKHFWRDVPPSRVGLLASERARRFGETALTFYRRVEAAPASTEDA
jgi:16S rRNA (guanine966-N2)-methyltransferase